jgi:hypothetical protein
MRLSESFGGRWEIAHGLPTTVDEGGARRAPPDAAGQPHRQPGQQRGGDQQGVALAYDFRRTIAACMAAGGYGGKAGHGPEFRPQTCAIGCIRYKG